MKRNKVDSIGYGNGKGIRLGRNLIAAGLIAISVGWTVITTNSDWYESINENGKKSAKQIYDTFGKLNN